MLFVTLSFISFTRIFFRSDSMETVNFIFDRIANHFGGDLFFKVITGYWIVFIAILLGYLIHWIPEKYKEKYRITFAKLPLGIMGCVVIVFVFAFYQLMSGSMQPFIYFQF